ncbi:hypothetical protein [Variovorax sp. E3]|uniref:hypothetical protein n=1 Tax=Variovorax sp. E3 TaxID=1914993 RepID=UPI0018DB268E|nr:hypothetical protein [Variovorax sp. E3]
MKLFFRKSSGYAIFCFFLLLLGALLIRDIASDPGLFTTVDNLNRVTDLTDPKTFASAALDIHRLGWVSEQNAWILALWPPGLVFLEAGILGVFGEGAPIVLILQVLGCAALAFMLALQRRLLSGFMNNALASTLPLLLFIFPMPRLFLLEPYGVVLGEVFSVAFFLVRGAVGAPSRAGTPNGPCSDGRRVLRLGGVLSLSVRVNTDGHDRPCCLGCGWCIWRCIRKVSAQDRLTYIATIRLVMVVLLVAHALMLPWRMHSKAVVGNFSWVQTGDLIFLNGLSSDKTLLDKGGDFVIKGTGNIACVVEPSYCDSDDRSLFFKALVSHPIEWYRIKFTAVVEYWNTFIFSRHRFTTWFHIQDDAGNLVYLLFLLAAVPLLWATRTYRWWLLMAWLIASFYAAFFVIFSLAHFEARYFYLPKIFSFVTGVNMLAMWWGMRRGREGALESKN